MSITAFGPRGQTANISCNQTASAPVQVKGTPGGMFTYQFVNGGGNTAYFAYNKEAGGTVTIPVPGTPGNGVPILSNEIVIYHLTPDAYITCICETGKTTNMLVTPGEGL